MIQFITKEIKEAVLWVKDVLTSLAMWTFRWFVRWTMLGVLFVLIGKGCQPVVIAMASSFFKSPRIQSNVTGQNPNSPMVSQGAKVPEMSPAEIKRPGQSSSTSAEVRSAWSALRYIGQDLMRWFRK